MSAAVDSVDTIVSRVRVTSATGATSRKRVTTKFVTFYYPNAMFERKLLALGYPQPQSFNVEDGDVFRNMVVWLEDQKIRHYKIEDRSGIKNTKSSDWAKAFQAYLTDLVCPYQESQRAAVMDWLLGYAVRLEYGDDVEKYKNTTPPQNLGTSVGNTVPQGTSTNPLDSLDFEDPDFKAGVTSLSMMLQIPPYHDHLEQLKAICIVVSEKLSKEVIEKAKKSPKNEHIPLDKTPLGFDTGDYIINEAAKILRLLHVRDLRELQSQINQAIVAVQTVTANPKTDSRLGKIGRS